MGTDSITSGYSVPCARNFALPARLVAAWNTSMNVLPMILRLRSGSVTPLSRRRNSFDGVLVLQLDFEMAPENFLHHLRLAPAQQAVVDENAGELVADGLVQQRRRHAGIHAAAQAENHPFLADLRADLLDGLVDVTAHRPVLAAAADVVDEVGDDFPAARRVGHFGMKLQAEHFARAIFDRREFGILRDRDGFEAVGNFRELVAVRIPDLQRLRAVLRTAGRNCPSP